LTCSGSYSPDGIQYTGGTIPQGLHLILDSTVTIEREEGITHHAVDLATPGPYAIRVDIAEGAQISATGEDVTAVKLQSPGGDLVIDSAGHIKVTDQSGASLGNPATALVAELVTPDATGNIHIHHRAKSLLEGIGEESGGIYASHQGNGEVNVMTGGDVSLTGVGGYGVFLWARNATTT